MSRFADVFIALCILIVSASAAMVLNVRFDVGLKEAAVAGFGLAFVLIVLNFWRGRGRDRSRAAAADIDVLSERLDRLRGEVDAMARRLTQIEGSVAARRDETDLEPVLAEVEMLGALLRQVTETVADIDMRVASAPAPAAAPVATSQPAPVPAPAPAPAAVPSNAASRSESGQRPTAAPDHRSSAPAAPQLPARFAALGEKGFLDIVRRAIEANRMDIYLQPMVTLPQRKVRYYECFTRLRSEDGETIFPADYIHIAEPAGIMPQLDNQILLRAVQLVRRLAGRSKEVGIFCNLSTASLSDAQFFRDFMSFLDANKALSDVLVFEFPQAAVRALGPIELEALSALSEMGFRFSVDQVEDLRMAFPLLHSRGFRFVKVAGDRLLDRKEFDSDIHAADLANHLARFGLELIVDHVETEAQVVDLLDYGVKLGQGFVFSPPRPVRSEALSDAMAGPGPTVIVSAPPVAVVAAPAQQTNAPRRAPARGASA